MKGVPGLSSSKIPIKSIRDNFNENLGVFRVVSRTWTSKSPMIGYVELSSKITIVFMGENLNVGNKVSRVVPKT